MAGKRAFCQDGPVCDIVGESYAEIYGIGPMNDLVESLDNCVKQSAFILKDSREIAWSDYRRLFRNRKRDSRTWWPWGIAELKIDDLHVADLAAKLEPVFNRFLHKETGRFGNGLTGFIGGTTDWAFPTVEGFARPLIIAAVKVGAEEITQQLCAWIRDEVFRYRYNVVLKGIDLDGPLEFEGLRLEKSPALRPDHPVVLPSLSPSATRLDAVQMSIDCELAPSFCLPDGHPNDLLYWTPTETILGTTEFGPPFAMMEKGQWLDGFCQSMSLASNSHVDWHLLWRDVDAFAAFADGPESTSHKGGYGHGSSINETKISRACLEETRRIQLVLEKKNLRQELNLAIDRWVMSKKSKSVEDRLIDLRIALEALFEVKGGEKAFLVATRGAWHLGKNVRDRVRIWETLRDTYSASSRVIHGDKLKHAAKDPSLVSSAQNICREGILKRLDETKAPVWKDIILGKDE